MLIKQITDHLLVNTPTCGELREILKNRDYKPLGIAIAIDIEPTKAHYHLDFDEIYFVLDGKIFLRLYDPQNDTTNTYELNANELCIITKGIHHKIIDSTSKNRLCVISVPPFHADDEHSSDKI